MSIQSFECCKFHLIQMQAGLASLRVGFAMSGKEALMIENFTYQEESATTQ